MECEMRHCHVRLQTKIPGCFDAATFVESDLKQLNTDYLDLVLLHSPIGLCSGTARQGIPRGMVSHPH
jgi:predicted oxidoreductase